MKLSEADRALIAKLKAERERLAKKNKRTSLSNKTRFDIFKRDGFVCQYCGNTPPAVVLEVDHVVPVCAGGSSDEYNLITACFECNRGKSGTPLSEAPQSVHERAERMAEAEAQIKAYARLLAARKQRATKAIKAVDDMFAETFGVSLSRTDRQSLHGQFLPHLMPDEVEEAMDLACARIREPARAWKYFCGICWTKIRKQTDG